MDKDKPGFELTFADNETRMHPQGYWYACTNDGNWDADGDSPLSALARLVTVMHKALIEESEH
jgi:hypothetical protein